ncbi:MAG: hypothetical protein AUI36_09690 [Cyanobacteria bacterium 13_1_40CM_2_61_4]|nr:MAG: hypothetical protein AUI36_09690 [Cyanobacteria bacterium 13_1_40CM_2_61_4]
MCSDVTLNTALGIGALVSATSGSDNTAVGFDALSSDTIGGFNTAVGFRALNLNTSSNNTALGFDALQQNTAGSDNTAVGEAALADNGTGIQNTAVGGGALVGSSSGNDNTAIGWRASLLNSGSSNTAVGSQALINSTGSSNTALGFQAGLNLTTGSNNIDIGNKGKAGESNYIRIGTKGTQTHTLIAGISGVTVAGGVGVIIDTNGKLGTVVSSERFKDSIKSMDKESEAILALQPVTFRYKPELDPEGIPQFGLVAEQVEKVNPALVARDDQGKPYTVRYEAVNAMLLNEFLKEHRTVQGQQKEIDALKAELKEQKALIQKVSAQVEISRPASQIVLNNQ